MNRRRLLSIFVALITTSALAFYFYSGISCTFLLVTHPTPQDVISAQKSAMINDSFNQTVSTSTSNPIGLFCSSSHYKIDSIWMASRIFIAFSIILSSITTIIGWAFALFIPPNSSTWKILSFLSATTFIVTIPSFLIFDTSSCRDPNTCQLDSGALVLVISAVLEVSVLIITQCLSTPNWADESETEKEKRNHAKNAMRSIEDDGSIDDVTIDVESAVVMHQSKENDDDTTTISGITYSDANTSFKSLDMSKWSEAFSSFKSLKSLVSLEGLKYLDRDDDSIERKSPVGNDKALILDEEENKRSIARESSLDKENRSILENKLEEKSLKDYEGQLPQLSKREELDEDLQQEMKSWNKIFQSADIPCESWEEPISKQLETVPSMSNAIVKVNKSQPNYLHITSIPPPPPYPTTPPPPPPMPPYCQRQNNSSIVTMSEGWLLESQDIHSELKIQQMISFDSENSHRNCSSIFRSTSPRLSPPSPLNSNSSNSIKLNQLRQYDGLVETTTSSRTSSSNYFSDDGNDNTQISSFTFRSLEDSFSEDERISVGPKENQNMDITMYSTKNFMQEDQIQKEKFKMEEQLNISKMDMISRDSQEIVERDLIDNKNNGVFQLSSLMVGEKGMINEQNSNMTASLEDEWDRVQEMRSIDDSVVSDELLQDLSVASCDLSKCDERRRRNYISGKNDKKSEVKLMDGEKGMFNEDSCNMAASLEDEWDRVQEIRSIDDSVVSDELLQDLNVASCDLGESEDRRQAKYTSGKNGKMSEERHEKTEAKGQNDEKEMGMDLEDVLTRTLSDEARQDLMDLLHLEEQNNKRGKWKRERSLSDDIDQRKKLIALRKESRKRREIIRALSASLSQSDDENDYNRARKITKSLSGNDIEYMMKNAQRTKISEEEYLRETAEERDKQKALREKYESMMKESAISDEVEALDYIKELNTIILGESNQVYKHQVTLRGINNIEPCVRNSVVPFKQSRLRDQKTSNQHKKMRNRHQLLKQEKQLQHNKTLPTDSSDESIESNMINLRSFTKQLVPDSYPGITKLEISSEMRRYSDHEKQVQDDANENNERLPTSLYVGNKNNQNIHIPIIENKKTSLLKTRHSSNYKNYQIPTTSYTTSLVPYRHHYAQSSPNHSPKTQQQEQKQKLRNTSMNKKLRNFSPNASNVNISFTPNVNTKNNEINDNDNPKTTMTNTMINKTKATATTASPSASQIRTARIQRIKGRQSL